MELRGKDKETGMASSMCGYNNRDANSSKVSISAVGMGEMIRDQAADNNIHGGGIFNLPQTLGHQHQHPPPPPLYHHDHHHQFNPHPQQNKQRGPSNPDADPDPVSIANTTTASTSTREANRSGQRSPAAAVPTPPPAQAPITSTAIVASPSVRYKECLKNHAASTGSHVVDGCGEFMPSGEDETPEALKCAACDCHRNFHRKELDGEPQSYPQSQSAANSCYTYNHHHHHNHPSRNSNHTNIINRLQQQPPPYYHQHHRIAYTSPQTASIAPMMMTFGGGGGSSGGLEESSSEDLNKFHSTAAGQTSVQPKKKKKRFRTKFTQEQKEKMTEFAEKLEWRIQKQDDEAVHDFCAFFFRNFSCVGGQHLSQEKRIRVQRNQTVVDQLYIDFDLRFCVSFVFVHHPIGLFLKAEPPRGWLVQGEPHRLPHHTK